MSIYNNLLRFAHIEAYYGLEWPEFTMPQHTHKRCEIMYVMKGKCNILINETAINLKENQFVFIDENIPHGLLVVKGSPCHLLNLEFSCRQDYSKTDLHELKRGSEEFSDFMYGKSEYIWRQDMAGVGTALNELINELEGSGNSLLTDLLFKRLLIVMARCKETTAPGVSYYRKGLAYIAEHFDEDISVSDVAAYVGISQAYLQILFSRNGISVMSAVHSQRLEKACFLLKNTKQTITDIAFTCGYNSRQHFGYCFENKYGQGPSAYRKTQGGIQPPADTKGFKTL